MSGAILRRLRGLGERASIATLSGLTPRHPSHVNTDGSRFSHTEVNIEQEHRNGVVVTTNTVDKSSIVIFMNF